MKKSLVLFIHMLSDVMKSEGERYPSVVGTFTGMMLVVMAVALIS